MNNQPVLIITAIAVLLGGGTIGLATYQNLSRTTQLSFDLGFAAWQLPQPVVIPALMWGCFLVGFLLGALLFVGRASRASRKARRLEQELALAGGGSSDGWR